MNMVMSWFIAKKTPDVKPVQIFIKPQNTFEIKSKSFLYIIIHIYLGIRNGIIEKKNI